MNRVNAGLVVSGIIDGTTVVYDISAVDASGNPVSLTQYFDEAKCTPDWDHIWQHGTAAEKATLPRLIIRAFDTSSGQDITDTINITAVRYNDAVVGFDSEGVSSSQGGVPGLLKMTTFSYGGNDIPCIMIIGNPADALSNPDDDRITFDGTVVSSGGQISFSEIGKDIAIRPVADANAGYTVELHVPLNVPKFIMTNNNNTIQSTQRLARLYYNGVAVTASEMAGYQIKFFDITGPTEVELKDHSAEGGTTDITIGQTSVSGDTITIGPEAVDCLMTIRCRIYDANGNELASGTSAVYDLSDPYAVKWIISDTSAGTGGVELTGLEPRFRMRTGQTKYIIPKLYTDKGDTFPAGSSAANVTWTFNADDANTGATISDLPGVPSTAGQTYCSLRYQDVILTDASGNKVQRPVKIHAQSSEF